MVDSWSYELIPLSDGRMSEVLVYGAHDRALVSFTGTPGAAVPNDELGCLCEQHSLRLVMPLRPGYGQSNPRPGRRIVDFADDVGAVLEHLGLQDVICVGASGGGPHSLAMAAALPQCRAAAVLVSPAPRDAAGLDFYGGMALSNQEEWRLADQGEDAVKPWLLKAASEMREATIEGFIATFGDAISAEDRETLAADDSLRMAASFHKALESGIEGWLEDDIALTTPWGFVLQTITTPVTFWSGKQDQFVSYRHSVWMAQQVPGADLRIFANEGHLSLRQHHMPEIVQDLVNKAGFSPD